MTCATLLHYRLTIYLFFIHLFFFSSERGPLISLSPFPGSTQLSSLSPQYFWAFPIKLVPGAIGPFCTHALGVECKVYTRILPEMRFNQEMEINYLCCQLKKDEHGQCKLQHTITSDTTVITFTTPSNQK